MGASAWWSAVRMAKRAGYVVVLEPGTGMPVRRQGHRLVVDPDRSTEKNAADLLAILHA